MRSSEISAVGVWGVSMSMRVRHGLRARGALVSTPLFEIQALTGGPWASKNARSRSTGKLYLFARKPDHHWHSHRLGMGRSDPSILLMTTLVYSLEPSRRAWRTTPVQLRVLPLYYCAYTGYSGGCSRGEKGRGRVRRIDPK